MNPKQTIPLAVTLAPLIAAAPAVLIVGGIVALAAWAFSDDKKNKLDAAPDAENSPKPAETPSFREIPAIPPAEYPPISASLTAEIPHPSQLLPAISANIPPEKLPLVAKKIISRADMATIFENGQRSMTRNEAVSALKQLGYGKTAAYSALSEYGRFSAWLIFGSDGIISWAE